jgi:sugar lactone lactonase YvrE
VGSFALRESGGAVVALVDGFHLLDFDTGEVSFLTGPEHVPGTRFNDGKVSPDGRFWAGTMDEEQLSRPIAALYRLDPDGTLHPMVGDLIVSNGLAWTGDGRTMYHSDSKGPIIWAYDYDPGTGGITNRRVVARRPNSSVARTARRSIRTGSIGVRGSQPVCSTSGARMGSWCGASRCRVRTRPPRASADRT